MSSQAKTDQRKYADAVLKIARQALGRGCVSRVYVADEVDSEGQACLNITIVLSNENVIEGRGAILSGITVSIVDLLRKQGDERFPYTRYVTEAELREVAA